MTQTLCKKCKRGFRTLTKESLCAGCYQNKYGTWAEEFSDLGKGGRK